MVAKHKDGLYVAFNVTQKSPSSPLLLGAAVPNPLSHCDDFQVFQAHSFFGWGDGR